MFIIYRDTYKFILIFLIFSKKIGGDVRNGEEAVCAIVMICGSDDLIM